jgi:hypothetical protein
MDGRQPAACRLVTDPIPLPWAGHGPRRRGTSGLDEQIVLRAAGRIKLSTGSVGARMYSTARLHG